MANWKEGDRVRIVERRVTEDDRKNNRYFPHMANLTGTIQNLYSHEEISIKVDPSGLSQVSAEVHTTAVVRMRENFLSKISEEQKKMLSPEELNFDANFVLLVRGADIEPL